MIAVKGAVKGDANRRAMLAKVHMAKKELGLGEDVYRDLLKRVSGKRSAGDMTSAELHKAIEAFKAAGWKQKRRAPKRAGGRPLAPGRVAAKVRALWITLYQLGEVENPAEASIDAFVGRQSNVDALRFLPADEARDVVEPLKEWAARCGWTENQEDPLILLTLQWQRLIQSGAVEGANDPKYRRLDGYCSNVVGRGCGIGHLSYDEAQKCIEALRRKIRKAKARAGNPTERTKS